MEFKKIEENFDFNNKITKKNIHHFAAMLIELSNKIGMKVSSRGWCYLMEQRRIINKDQFDKIEQIINRCRKQGILPIDFTAEDKGRAFSGVYTPNADSPLEHIAYYVKDPIKSLDWYDPDWWYGEEYYVQMIVEKVDLVTLFLPVCRRYKIPIANAKGWSSMLQRAIYARRFKEAEERGLKCVLLYCGDHDPDGIRISDTIRKNLEDLNDITWDDGTRGYDPQNLIIDRFGLEFAFIEEHGFTWIDNLITGRKKNLANPKHRNHHMDYVQDYINTVGVRKCEANAIVTEPRVARNLVTEAIEKYLGKNAFERFDKKIDTIREDTEELLNNSNIINKLDDIADDIESLE